MYQTIASTGAPLQPPPRPAWLRLVREPLSRTEQTAVAAGPINASTHVAELLRARAPHASVVWIVK